MEPSRDHRRSAEEMVKSLDELCTLYFFISKCLVSGRKIYVSLDDLSVGYLIQLDLFSLKRPRFAQSYVVNPTYN